MRQSQLRKLSFGTKIRLLLWVTVLPLLILIVVLLSFFIKYNKQYENTIENLTIASEFSFGFKTANEMEYGFSEEDTDFKTTMDFKMYQCVIKPQSFEELSPLGDVERARSVVDRLTESSTNEESLARLRNMDKYLNNLEKSIVGIRDNKNDDNDDSRSVYEENMNSLNNNIRILTELIQDEVHEYIFHETVLLAELRSQTGAEVTRVTTIVGIASVAVFIFVFMMALVTTDSMTKPLKELNENIKMVGEGDFTVRDIDSVNDEVQVLRVTFKKMVERISILMENIRQDKDNLRRIELRLLQEQINPHFLYNTFDTIMWLTEDSQYEMVKEVTSALSNFYRISLSDGADIVTVKEECQLIRNYLDIQTVRYRDILEYEVDMPSELEEFMIPKLTLQPVVENALYHGIKNRRGGGCIKITGRLDKDVMTFVVRDNGIGMTPETMRKVQEAAENPEKRGFGLYNVKERLQLYYGAQCEFEIKSEYGSYTEMSFSIPAKNEIAPKENDTSL